MQIHSLFNFNLNFSFFNVVQLKGKVEGIIAMYQLFLSFLFVSRVGSGYTLCFLIGFKHNYIVNNTWIIFQYQLLEAVSRNIKTNLLIPHLHSFYIYIEMGLVRRNTGAARAMLACLLSISRCVFSFCCSGLQSMVLSSNYQLKQQLSIAFYVHPRCWHFLLETDFAAGPAVFITSRWNDYGVLYIKL